MGWNVLLISIRSNWSIVSFKVCVSLLNFLFSWSIHRCEWVIKVSHYYCVNFSVLSPVHTPYSGKMDSFNLNILISDQYHLQAFVLAFLTQMPSLYICLLRSYSLLKVQPRCYFLQGFFPDSFYLTFFLLWTWEHLVCPCLFIILIFLHCRL